MRFRRYGDIGFLRLVTLPDGPERDRVREEVLRATLHPEERDPVVARTGQGGSSTTRRSPAAVRTS
ncbi:MULTISPECIES: hypothetical protein [unclassified Streptomyces]|uniref:hypothetical protein n=1 Tax=unclassified Streptomyces TaxID=2593676 RepID=UPI0011610E33|nr:hypothetical protein [Streptomyces sp. TSRI0107]